jgi:hypothetical protein
MSALRVLMLLVAVLIFVGIWLTGWTTAHWILYIPGIMMAFAGITGICPGIIILKKLGLKDKPMTAG